jgi:hypothetical protein
VNAGNMQVARSLIETLLALAAAVRSQPGCERAFATIFEVLNSADAAELSAAVACPDRNITATWQAAIVLQSTIIVAAGTTLTLRADAAEAIIDGAGQVQLFDIQGSLSLDGLVLQNGKGQANGGAQSQMAKILCYASTTARSKGAALLPAVLYMYKAAALS